MLNYTDYVYRGHGDSSWKLEPTLDRVIKSPTSERRRQHLDRFKLETRGRRGPNPPLLETDNDWWALGQHHGLSTPLLDWTESPFVALYFAAVSARKQESNSMSVFALFQSGVDAINEGIVASNDIKLINGQKPTISIVKPESSENSRLVSQRGLFTRGPNNLELESWIDTYRPLVQEYLNNAIFLLRLDIPTTGLTDCLRYLNRMNINHSTLFPDLVGASEFINHHLVIRSY